MVVSSWKILVEVPPVIYVVPPLPSRLSSRRLARDVPAKCEAPAIDSGTRAIVPR